MAHSKVLISQALIVISIIIFSTWGATQWAAEALGYQARLGVPWFKLGDVPIYKPWRLFQWWYAYEPYAPQIFNHAGLMSVSGSFIGIVVAITMSVWRGAPAKICQHLRLSALGAAQGHCGCRVIETRWRFSWQMERTLSSPSGPRTRHGLCTNTFW